MGLDETGEPHPLDAYDIGCDEGAWNAFLRKMWCGAQAWPFAFGKWAIGISTDFMGWALEFRIAEGLAPVAGSLSRVYDVSLLGPLAVRHLAWTLALLVSGWHFVRARFARGASEIASTFLIAAIGGILLANPQGYFEGSIALAKNSSGSILEAIDDTLNGGRSEQGADAIRDRLQGVLRRSFVAEPYDLINWGGALSGECAAARDEILDDGPWGGDDEPRAIMRSHGCDAEADFNERPTDGRAAASLTVALAAIGASVLLVLTAAVVIAAQLTLAALFAGSSIVWVLALFPGGRALLWWWIERLAWAIGATVGVTFVLSWLAISVATVLDATGDFSIIQRCLVALLLVVFAFRLRSHVGRAVTGVSRRLGEQFGEASTAGSHRIRWSTGAVAGAGMAGFGLRSMAQSWVADYPMGHAAYNRLYARPFNRGLRRQYPGVAGRAVRRGRAALVDQAKLAASEAAADARRLGRWTADRVAVIRSRAITTEVAVRGTNASARAHERFAEARAARAQRAQDAGHPLRALLDAHRGTGTTVLPASEEEPATRGTRAQRARDAGHPLRALLDAHQGIETTVPPAGDEEPEVPQ